MNLLLKLLPVGIKNFMRFLVHFLLGNLMIYRGIRNLKGKSVITVYFVVSQPNLSSRLALVSFFRNDPKYKVVFLVLPNQELPEQDHLSSLNYNLEFVAQYGCEIICCWTPEDGFISTEVIIEHGFVFLEQLSKSITPAISLPALARKGLLIYVPYGVMLSKSSMNHYSGSNRFFLWKVFLESTWHKNNLKFTRGKRFEVSGTFSASSIPPKNYSFSREILWAPHWSVGNSEYNYSTFINYASDFLDFARTNPHISFVLRPHQRLGVELANSGKMSITNYNSYLDEWTAEPNCRLSQGITSESDFDNSLCMITDSVSFLFDYTFTSKPLLRLDRGSTEFNDLGNCICMHHVSAKNFREVEQFITAIHSGVDENLLERSKLLSLLQGITPPNHVEIISTQMQGISKK